MRVNAGCKNSLQEHIEEVETPTRPDGRVINMASVIGYGIEALPNFVPEVRGVSFGSDDDVERIEGELRTHEMTTTI